MNIHCWIRGKLGITALQRKVTTLEQEVKVLTKTVEIQQGLIRECTSVSSDINFRHDQDSIVFVAGRYKKKDHVHLFNIKHESMNHLIDVLKDLDKTGRKGFFDEPLHMDIKTWIDRG